MNHNITALYDAYVAKHPQGVTTSEIRAYLTAQIKNRLADQPRDLDREASNLVKAALPRLREQRKDLARSSMTRIVEHITGTDKQLDVQAISTLALPTGDQAGVDKTLKFWTLADVDVWLEARREHRDAAVTAFENDETATTRLKNLMRAAGAFMIGDLLPLEVVS